jgi:hypothetical protein
MSRPDYVYFKSINLIRFFHFYVAHNTKNFVIKFRILVDYIINYILIYFHNFLKLKIIIFLIFKNGGNTCAQESKALFIYTRTTSIPRLKAFFSKSQTMSSLTMFL